MAQNLVTFLRADDIQTLIAGFGVPEYGETLFYPWDPEICGADKITCTGKYEACAKK